MIEIRDDGKIMHEGMVIGTITEEECEVPGGLSVLPTVTLNLAWCKMAAVHVRVLADPDVDRKRDGVVLDR